MERDSGKVLDDVFSGYVSQTAAERDYGVVVANGMTLDEAAPRPLRAELRKGAKGRYNRSECGGLA